MADSYGITPERADFGLLSPEVGVTLRVGERVISLGPPKEQLILAILLLSAGRPLAVDVIVTRVWGERPPPKVREALTIHISRLRRRLREVVGEAARIEGRGVTYGVMLDGCGLDLDRYRFLRRQAAAVAKSGDPGHALRLLKQAEGLWPGEALAGLPGEWARRMGQALAQERADGRRERIDLELRLGRHVEVLNELYELEVLHPSDESVAAQLMTALYRGDRQGEALEVYGRVSAHLRETLGTEPGNGLRALHRQILRQDPDLAVTPIYRRGEREPQPDTVPSDIPHFTGRREQIDAVRAMRAGKDGPLVVAVQGMAGVGKSALAIHIAHRLRSRYPDARLYLDLRAHDHLRPPLDASTALLMLLRMLGVPPASIPGSLPERAAMWQAELAYRRAIVILEDAAGVEQVRPLLGGASPALVLVTSRARFDDVPGVRCISLGEMPTGEATELATRLAGDRADPAGIDTVVRLCGGLPLMITLMAGRTGIEWLGAGQAHGISGVRDAVGDDYRKIEAAFELSYRDLGEWQQLVFRRLGLYPCGRVTAAVAAALCDVTPGRAQAAIDVLVRHCLLQETGAGGYRFHDLVRGYAHDRARREDPASENDRAVTRLLDHYLARVESAADALRRAQEKAGPEGGTEGRSASVPEARAWLGEEWGTVLQLVQYAVEHGWKEHGVRLMREMAEYLDTEGYWEDAAAGHALALHACRELGDGRGIARASLDLGFMRFRTGRHKDALRHTHEALMLYRTVADRGAEATCWDQIGVICWASAHYREALAHYEEAGAIFSSLGDAKGEADALGHTGIVYWHLGRYQESLDLLSRALALYQKAGDRRGEAKALNNMGDVHKRRGYHRDAIRLYQDSLEIFKEIAGRQNHAILNSNLGDIHQYESRYDAALECYRTAMATFQETGDRRNQADILTSIGTTYLLMRRADEALIHFEKAVGIAERISDSYQHVRAVAGVGDVHRAAGRCTLALEAFHKGITMARAIGDPYQEARIHASMADTFLYLDAADAARISWRQAYALFEQLDLPEAEMVRARLRDLDGEAP
ncbi:tetratricopeptide repeat protein [Sphaerisporangium sp. TRM90804]|uniref:AfsR/SARP family transcriptional regulator n=1 Tax=Sphaerisporangium sp. TRM90804 TaxID=3031113 RepID=UPI00244CE93E|nr:tetratricopeptide repeat protein [Sphaerisporangium sp. TRM90804]MDH2424911.1 tetratricopeptide repeat protein [Sphaerisporangium sp. TRM90804]